MTRVQLVRYLQAVARFFFVSIPVWIWQNVFVAAFQSVWGAFTGQVRRHALWIILGGFVMLLVVTKQYQLLDILLQFSLVIGLMVFGFWVMFRGVFPKKKKKK